MKFVRSAIVLSAAAAVALVPTAAQADTKSHRDAIRDVRSVAYDPNTREVTESPSTAEPAATLGDIAKVRVTHGGSTIKLTMRLRDLSRVGFEHVHSFAIASPKGARIAYVVAAPGRWKGKAFLTKPSGKRVSCSVGRRIDYDDNTVVVRVPRSCLGRPSVVKVGAATLIGDGTKVYYDQAYATGGEFTDSYVLSPRIRR